MKSLYIFDLDGTLALIDHRRPILEEKRNSKRWDDFYLACVRDQPNKPVIDVMHCLRLFADIEIWSGRSSVVKKETTDWLVTHTHFMVHDIERILKMRPENDSTPDNELKMAWLQEMHHSDRERLAGVFDDRQKVVDMWRNNGITCFQVASGDF